MGRKQWLQKAPNTHEYTCTNTHAHTVSEPSSNMWLLKASKPGNNISMHCLDYASAPLPVIVCSDSTFDLWIAPSFSFSDLTASFFPFLQENWNNEMRPLFNFYCHVYLPAWECMCPLSVPFLYIFKYLSLPKHRHLLIGIYHFSPIFEKVSQVMVAILFSIISFSQYKKYFLPLFLVSFAALFSQDTRINDTFLRHLPSLCVYMPLSCLYPVSWNNIYKLMVPQIVEYI